MVRCTIPEPTMKKTLITAVVSMVLAFFSVPTFAKRYVVNGHVASTAEVQYLVSRGFQPAYGWSRVRHHGSRRRLQHAAADRQ
jgi:hypothetical protein